jgi:hypothetical protein
VSDFDLNIQENINRRIEEILNPPDPDPDPIIDPDTPEISGGVPVSESECLLLQHVAAQEIAPPDTPAPSSGGSSQGPSGTGGYNQSGQCLFCTALLPLKPSIKLQLPTTSATFYNSHDWVPQIKKRLTDGHTLSEVIDELEIIDHETPFGASQLYTAMREAAIAATGETFESRKKVFYVGSDNSENFSLVTRDDAIDEINAVDGDRNSPVVYTLFSTSSPMSLAAQLERTEVGDIEKIVQGTGGQSSLLTSSGFLDQILNWTVGGATGGLGWGKYTRQLSFDELSAVTAVTSSFLLPVNTQGYLRFRYSEDGFNFADWTERFEGSQTIDFVDFFAKIVEYEVILTTGFTEGITEEYDSTPTGIPKLISINWGTSSEREDFMFLDSEEVLTNVQQLAAAFEGTIPTSSTVEIGIASSNSHDWRDFQNAAHPAIEEFGKTFLVERTEDPSSLVPVEPLITRDGLLFSATYGSWDPNATVTLFRANSDGEDVPVLSGFRLHPRYGQIYFDARQPLTETFKLAIVNSDTARVGLRLRNRLHTDSIVVNGVGYIYSTNDEKPIALSQVAPRAVNVRISPQTPNSTDTIYVLYNFVDLNGDPESGTLIKWFINASQILELNNMTSWSNSDLQQNHRLQPNDKIYVNVTPSDGRDLGTSVVSPTVTVVAIPPIAQNLAVLPIRFGVVNDRFDTASTFKVEYTFQTNDEGAVESGTVIRWEVDGVLFQEEEFSEGMDLTNGDPRELVPGEAGQTAHVIGNEIVVEVTPKTAVVTGETSRSTPFLVVNSIPIISNVVVSPTDPHINSDLLVTYNIDDPDIDDSSTTQTDQSDVSWYKSRDNITFTLESEAPTPGHPERIDSFWTTEDDYWKAIITGYDGLDTAPPVESNVVRVSPR